MSWRRSVESVLRDGMRYCFPTETGFAKMSEVEFSGHPDEPGFLDGVLGLVHDMRRAVFFEGYRLGAMDALEDLGPRDPAHGGKLYEFDAELNKAGAWKRWGEVDKL